MKAVVMAGGEGSRLRPLTLGRPKPMVPLVNRPMLEHVLLLLKRHGITEVIITVQYMAAFIQNQLGDGSDLGMTVTYSVEDQPLGTAGSVRQAAESLKSTFLVISGDALTDFDLKAIVAYHKKQKAMATLTLYRVANPLDYGVVVTGDALAGKVAIDWTAEQVDGAWKEPGVDIEEGAQIHGPVYLGRDVKVQSGAVIHGPSVIRDNTVVERRAHIDRSIIWGNTYVG